MGEILSIIVALSWTATAMFAEVASRRMGTLPLNVFRMLLSLVLLGITLLFLTGSALPMHADCEVWGWLLLSGFVGYVFGDYCLFNSYLVIGSRFGQLFMTLAAPFAALAAWLFLGETLSWKALLGMTICLSGIGMSIMARGTEEEADTPHKKRVRIKLPLRGVLLGIGAGAGQGIGLVLSKIGMTHYTCIIPATDVATITAVPFASTMIRAVAGLIGFGGTMIALRRTHLLRSAFRDRRGVTAGIGAVILGPFIGVSMSLMAVQMAPAGVAQTLMSLTPVFILLPSHLIFHTHVTRTEVVGAVVAVLGVSLFFV